jgi:transposase-like protein
MDTNQTARILPFPSPAVQQTQAQRTCTAEQETFRAPAKGTATKPRKTKPLAERFAAKVDTSAGPDACHPWTGSTMQASGYGQVSAVSARTGKRTMRTAHTVAFELAHGPVPEGKRVLHSRGCNKRCCNPAHLRAGTQKENMADAVAEKRMGRRLTKTEVLGIVALHEKYGASAADLARSFGVDPVTTRKILRGATYSALTGIERHRLTGGRPRKVATAPVNSEIIVAPTRRSLPRGSFTQALGRAL